MSGSVKQQSHSKSGMENCKLTITLNAYINIQCTNVNKMRYIQTRNDTTAYNAEFRWHILTLFIQRGFSMNKTPADTCLTYEFQIQLCSCYIVREEVSLTYSQWHCSNYICGSETLLKLTHAQSYVYVLHHFTLYHLLAFLHNHWAHTHTLTHIWETLGAAL